MTIRTLVGYWRVCWSWLMTGAAKDKITLSPSCAAPSMCEEKNIGQLNMANPYTLVGTLGGGGVYMANPAPEWMYAQQSAANPYWERMSHIELTAAYSKANYEIVAEHYAKLAKFRKQIVLFERLKEKRKTI